MEISVKEKYQGIQTLFKVANESSCHFLALLSIADEENIRLKNGRPGIDFIEATRIAMKNNWMDKEFTVTVAGSLALLKHYTGRVWTRKEVNVLPGIIKDNEYTEVIHKNKEIRHYHRRGFDTLVSSKTVKEGFVEKYYIYTSEAI